MPQNPAFLYLPWLFLALQLVAYGIGITLGVLGIRALRKYLRE